MEDGATGKTAGAGMGPAAKAAIILVLLAAAATAFYLRPGAAPATPSLAPPGDTVQPVNAPADALQTTHVASEAKPLPRLLDLGATKCVPCKMMAPILEKLKTDFAGRLDVEFIDVWEDPAAADKYGVQLIPTQIFYDAAGKELYRHQGFFSREDILAQWQRLGVSLAGNTPGPPAFSRLDPVSPDARPRNSVCYMCDGDANPRSRTVLKTDKGDVVFCSPHCFFITSSSMVDNKPSVEAVAVTDWRSGGAVPAASARYVLGVDAAGRPTIKSFPDQAAAAEEQQAGGGSVVDWTALEAKELATRCAFCDRAVYPEDACVVRVDGLRTWGCCPMCALGVAARMQKDVEVTAQDALTAEPVTVRTVGGHVGLVDPATAVAWAGAKRSPDGKLVSTGCFKQAFFTSEAHLRQWVEAHPMATGRMVAIEQALAEKMALTPQQISKACKIGECAPK